MEFAWSAPTEKETDDARMAKAAKERSYAGGRDEEDLEVQSQLTKPTRKVGGNASDEMIIEEDDEF